MGSVKINTTIMKRVIYVLRIFLVLMSFTFPLKSATIIPGGNLSSNQTWTIVNSPYIIQGDLTIQLGVTLTIEPGVIVKFMTSDSQGSGTDPARCELIIYGSLNAVGSSIDNIIFTSNGTPPSPGDWYGIIVKPNAVCNLVFCKIEYCLHNVLPDAAGTITGTVSVCKGTNNVIYAVSTITGATSYVWTLPTGATGTSTTNSISVSFGSTAISGSIKVKGHNNVGDGAESSLTITLNDIPAAPEITGIPTVTVGSITLLGSPVEGGTWISSDPTRATVDPNSGIVTGIAAGTSTITYSVTNFNGCTNFSKILVTVTTATGIENLADNSGLTLKNHPNPFSGNTTINYVLPSYGHVTLAILNLAGQMVKIIVNVMQTEGNYNINIDTRDLQSGVYIVTLSLKGNGNESIKTIRLIKGK
jgi:hypothetical protein